MKRIINCETGEVVDRELNEKELAQQAIDESQVIQVKKYEQDEAGLKEQAKIAEKLALLERLGITEEEARILLG